MPCVNRKHDNLTVYSYIDNIVKYRIKFEIFKLTELKKNWNNILGYFVNTFLRKVGTWWWISQLISNIFKSENATYDLFIRIT